MNVAIIVAAGSGKRFGTETPKQFLEIVDKPILFHTLDKFEKCPLINEIVLVIGGDHLSLYREAALRFRPRKVAKIVFGGKTRSESVFKGLSVIQSDAVQIVAVHDAARPFVEIEEISATIEKAAQTGAACLVAPVTDTIKEVVDGRIERTIDRRRLRRALTPQAFHIEILREAFRGADLGESSTDECYLLEQLGYRIATVEGSPRNIKITTPEDWDLAGILLGRNG